MNLNDIISAFGAHNWLALVMIAALYLRTIFSPGSKYAPDLSPHVLPVFSGVAGAIITADAAAMAHKPLSTVLVTGFVGLVSGGVFDGLLVCLFGKKENAPMWLRWIFGFANDAGAASVGGQSAAKRGFVRVELLVGAVILGVILVALSTRAVRQQRAYTPAIVQTEGEGCAWWNSGGSTQVENGAGPVTICIVTELLGGAGVDGTLHACVGSTMQQIAQIGTSLVQWLTAPNDAGMPDHASDVVCGAGSPPIAGAPQCVTTAQLLSLRSALGDVNARLAAQGN